jgi:hypothetical protein
MARSWSDRLWHLGCSPASFEQFKSGMLTVTLPKTAAAKSTPTAGSGGRAFATPRIR